MVVIDDFVNASELRLLNKYSSNLKYGWKSHTSKKEDFGHWNRQIVQSPKQLMVDASMMPQFQHQCHELYSLWNRIKHKLDLDRALSRVYVNGYTYGTDAYAHTDDPWLTDRTETIIVYLNDTWDKDWAGETVVYDDTGDIEKSVLPKPGRLFCFDSRRLHAARPLSRICPVLRKVLVFKTFSPTLISWKVRELYRLTYNIRHSDKTLFDHLIGTAYYLEKMNQPQHVIDAGLFHSIYGTEYFNGKVQGVTRDLITLFIGTEAENLVNIYCNTEDRINKWMTQPRKYGELLHIELANLIDQNHDGRYDRKIELIESCLLGV